GRPGRPAARRQGARIAAPRLLVPRTRPPSAPGDRPRRGAAHGVLGQHRRRKVPMIPMFRSLRRESRPTPVPRPDLRALGPRTLGDLLAPAAVEVTRDALRLERQYARTLVVTGYPRSVGPGWLAPLLSIEAPIEVSMHVAPLDSGPVQSALARKLVQLESSRRLADRGGRLADPERETAFADAEQLRDAVQRG